MKRTVGLLLVVTAAWAQEPPRTVTVEVPANRAWTRTGVVVEPGTAVRIEATGAVEAAGSEDRRAFYHQVPPEGRGEMFGYLPQPLLPALMLVGRLGDGPVVPVGRQVARLPGGPPYGSGELLLGINDDVVDDNAGAWRVTITLTRGPSENAGGPARPGSAASDPARPQEPPPLREGEPVWVCEGPEITNGKGEKVFAATIEYAEHRMTFSRDVGGKRVSNTMTWSIPPRRLQHGDKVTLTMTATTAPDPYIGGQYELRGAGGFQGENGGSNNPNWRGSSPHEGVLTFTFLPGDDNTFIQAGAGNVGGDAGPTTYVRVTWRYRKQEKEPR